MIANITDCTNFDPQGGLSVGPSVVKCQIYENLVKVDADGSIQPELAESWEYVNDTTIIFNLRQGVFFSNGEEMTADDVIFSLERACSSPASSSITSSVWGYTDDLEKYECDLEAVKACMAASAYPDGFSCRLVTDSTSNRVDAAEIIRNRLEQIDISVEVKVVEQAEYSEALHFLGFDMIMGLWVAVCDDPDYGMYPAYYSTCIDGQGNYGYVNDSKIDELLDLGRLTVDPVEREGYYVELQQRMAEIAANVPVWETNNVVALNKSVQAFQNDPNEFYHFSTCYFAE